MASGTGSTPYGSRGSVPKSDGSFASIFLAMKLASLSSSCGVFA
jgi:hypothetical protein